MASNGGFCPSALVAEAVRAAVQAGAPRRTVAATAAAVTTSVLAAMRGCVGASGSASAETPSASRRRRIKRKMKAAREAAASASQPQSDRAGAGLDGDVGSHQEEPPVPAVAEVPRPVSEQPPLTQPGQENLPRTTCTHCGAEFPSRRKLFEHLRDSGHDKLVDTRSIACSASDSGISASPADVLGGTAHISGEGQVHPVQPASAQRGGQHTAPDQPSRQPPPRGSGPEKRKNPLR